MMKKNILKGKSEDVYWVYRKVFNGITCWDFENLENNLIEKRFIVTNKILTNEEYLKLKYDK
jgi:hypothetical protein